MNTFSERLRNARSRNGLSQTALSKESGLALRTVQKYEAGNFEPGAYALKTLCSTLRVSADWLIGLSSDSTLSSPLPGHRQ